MELEKIIENTIVPMTFSMEEKIACYHNVIKCVNSMLPDKLYRFRSCSERNLSAFYNDELWFANGSVMNDDFDARLYYDKRRIKAWLDSFLSEAGELKPIKKLMTMEQPPQEMLELIPNAEYIFEYLKKIPLENMRFISNDLIQYLLSNLDVELKKVTEQIQHRTKFACFTQKIYSDMMWGRYSDNATGFALEYKFGNKNTITYSENNTQTHVVGNLFPVIYGNRRLDTTVYATYFFQIRMLMRMAQYAGITYDTSWVNAIVPCPDEFMVTKLAIKKSMDWKSEKEWRMFYTTNSLSLVGEEYSCVIQKPSGVYLGRKISEINQKIITDIAREKEIPVYKMDFDEDSKEYELKAYRII